MEIVEVAGRECLLEGKGGVLVDRAVKDRGEWSSAG